MPVPVSVDFLAPPGAEGPEVEGIGAGPLPVPSGGASPAVIEDVFLS